LCARFRGCDGPCGPRSQILPGDESARGRRDGQAVFSVVDGDGMSGSGFAVVVAGNEDEVAVTHANLVARAQVGRRGQLLTVEEGAVLRGSVVEFGALGGVDHDGTVAARDVTVLDDNVVVRGAADGVQSELERIDEVGIHHPELNRRSCLALLDLNERVGAVPCTTLSLLFRLPTF